jgi:sodium-dependent dicarboxylate transporter 2/3/5
MMPILAVTATAINVDPMILMVSATIAAGCAFMLPISTPPNAVVFGSGYLTRGDMVRVGFRINIFSIVLISLLTYYYLPVVW